MFSVICRMAALAEVSEPSDSQSSNPGSIPGSATKTLLFFLLFPIALRSARNGHISSGCLIVLRPNAFGHFDETNAWNPASSVYIKCFPQPTVPTGCRSHNDTLSIWSERASPSQPAKLGSEEHIVKRIMKGFLSRRQSTEPSEKRLSIRLLITRSWTVRWK